LTAIDNNAHQGLLEAAISLFYSNHNQLRIKHDSGEVSRYDFQSHNFTQSDEEILFIPPNGSLKNFDYSIFRIAGYLSAHDIKASLLSLEPPPEIFRHLFHHIYTPSTVVGFLDQLGTINRSHIFYRGWMHAYLFGAFLIKKYPDTIINIKDWNFCDQERYHFLFGELSLHDFTGIDYTFKKAEVVLSHYTKEETDRWSLEYDCDPTKFIFLPELCDENSFCQSNNKPAKPMRLVWACSLPPTHLPENMYPTKTIFRDTQLLTQKGLNIDYVVPESVYTKIMADRNSYLDILYESHFNRNFKLIKGKALSAKILQSYHYGCFMFSDATAEIRLFQYAVPSKFSLYLEAGLPVLVNKKNKALAKIVHTHGLGFVFSDDEVTLLPKKLLDIHHNYPEMQNNIYTFRTSYTYQSFDNLHQLQHLFL
jgi:hypothetical protein